MHKNAQKLERKTQSKISLHYFWLLCGVRIFCLDDAFSEFLNWKQAQKKVNNCSKRIRKGEK